MDQGNYPYEMMEKIKWEQQMFKLEHQIYYLEQQNNKLLEIIGNLTSKVDAEFKEVGE